MDFEGEMRPEKPAREWTLIAGIFAILVAVIAVPALMWRHHERHRPVLTDVRVVSATDGDPVFREGPRDVGPDESVTLAVALRLEAPGEKPRWMAPVEPLRLDGRSVDQIVADAWPEPDRIARVFWFTLEGAYLGGALSPETGLEPLAYRSYLAPEMGLGMLAASEPESHADDGINLGNTLLPVAAGTYRVYARVQVSTEDSVKPIFAVTSPGVEAIGDSRMVRISRRMDGPAGIDPAVGALFRLPGFEPHPDVQADPVSWCNGLTGTSSRTFAARAATGRCDISDLPTAPIGRFEATDAGISTPFRWGSDVRAGQLLRQGRHWLVLFSDDGDGRLGENDLVLHSWRRPPAKLPLQFALEEDGETVEIFGVGPAGPS